MALSAAHISTIGLKEKTVTFTIPVVSNTTETGETQETVLEPKATLPKAEEDLTRWATTALRLAKEKSQTETDIHL